MSEGSVKFFSFDDVQKFITNKEDTEFIQLYIADSRTVESVKRTGRVKRNIKSDLKYYQLTYRCIHSSECKSSSTGKRPGQR